MAVFNAVVSVVLVLAALVTVWFAWQAGRQSAKATEAAQETVKVVGALLTAARADERYRRHTQLREIGSLVDAIYMAVQLPAAMDSGGSQGFGSPLQDSLARLVAGVQADLPHCAAASVAGPASEVLHEVSLAKAEVKAALDEPHSAGSACSRSAEPDSRLPLAGLLPGGRLAACQRTPVPKPRKPRRSRRSLRHSATGHSRSPKAPYAIGGIEQGVKHVVKVAADKIHGPGAGPADTAGAPEGQPGTGDPS